MATPLIALSPFPPFDSQLTERPRLHYDSSRGVHRFPRVAGRLLRGVLCTIEDRESGLAAAIITVAHEQVPDEARRAAVQSLVQNHVPPWPITRSRLPEFRERKISDQDIRQAAAVALPKAPWDDDLLEEDGNGVGVWIRLDELRTYLAGEITELLLGPAGRSKENSKDAVPLDALPLEEANRTVSHAKRRRGQKAAEEHLLRIHAEQIEEQIEAQAELSGAEKEVWDLHYQRSFSPKQIAEKTGRASSTVRVLLHRARNKLQRAVQAVM